MRTVRFAIALIAILTARSAHGQRLVSEPLSVASRQALKASGFVQKATIYQIWLRSFTPEGTLKAAAERLPRVADLGATLVYLSPVMLQSKLGGFSNPYRIQDYYAIDPEYGTEADLKAFIARAHALQLRVLMDVVFYDTSPDSVMMQHPERYMQMEGGKVVLGNWGLPRVDFSKAEVSEYLIKNLKHWMSDVGVDGFRCDVAAGVPLKFWVEARHAVEKLNPNIILLAESEMPEEQLEAFDISYNFSYVADVLLPILRTGEPAYLIREHWEKQKRSWPQGAHLLHLIDDHDLERPVPQFGSEAAFAATVINFTLDGIPFLYNGDEIDDTTITNHQAHRAIDWELDPADNSNFTKSPLGKRHAKTFARYKRLFAIRKEEAALTSSDLIWVDNSAPENVVSFMRRTGKEEILVLVNLSNRKTAVTIDVRVADFMPAIDLLTGKKYSTSIAAGDIAFRTIQGKRDLDAFEALVLKRLPVRTIEPGSGRATSSQ
jgi:glycosidase